mmetsp:Transcript_15725/g.47561  ORF Transcript_15725/g.47561 Transcript_15725/m.47561 type:complete len:104 (+) Transcript_15725:467-778(+)
MLPPPVDAAGAGVPGAAWLFLGEDRRTSTERARGLTGVVVAWLSGTEALAQKGVPAEGLLEKKRTGEGARKRATGGLSRRSCAVGVTHDVAAAGDGSRLEAST